MEINRGKLRLVSTALLAAVLLHRGAEAAELKVCVDQSSPTARMDANLARAVAQVQGTQAQVIRFDGGSDADDDGLAPRVFRKLATTQCQLVLGFPLDAQDAAAPEGLRATRPYGRTGFVLVTRQAAPAGLDALPQGSAVAVTYMTTPNLYFADHPRLTPQVFTSDAAALRALKHGEVGAAMLWRPYVAAHAGALRMSALHEPHAAWNLVALYADANAPVAQGFELALDELRQSGRLQKLLHPYADVIEPAAAAAPARFDAEATQPRLIRVAERRKAAKAPPALYTAQQAEAGEQAFQQNCAVCHGPKLEGRAGPALKGPGFANAQAHFSVGDVFSIVSQNMPAPAPGTLPHEDYVNIMSFLLRENGYPAGNKPLSFEAAGKSKVKLIYRDTGAK